MAKGLLKSNQKLKIGLGAAFFTLWAATIGVTIGGMVKYNSIKDDIENQYPETEVYQNYVLEQKEEINQRLENGEIDEKQANSEIEDLDSWESIKTAILKDDAGNEPFQKKLEDYNKYNLMYLIGVTGENVFNIINASYWLSRLYKFNKERKQVRKEIEQKHKQLIEDMKIEHERKYGKRLEDYTEEVIE